MSEERKVKCVKFGVLLPGMKRKPFPDELGEKLFQNVSQDAWNLWIKEMTKIINEYRLSMANPEHQKFLRECVAYFFFPAGEPPKPPGAASGTPSPGDEPKIKFV